VHESAREDLRQVSAWPSLAISNPRSAQRRIQRRTVSLRRRRDVSRALEPSLDLEASHAQSAPGRRSVSYAAQVLRRQQVRLVPDVPWALPSHDQLIRQPARLRALPAVWALRPAPSDSLVKHCPEYATQQRPRGTNTSSGVSVAFRDRCNIPGGKSSRAPAPPARNPQLPPGRTPPRGASVSVICVDPWTCSSGASLPQQQRQPQGPARSPHRTFAANDGLGRTQPPTPAHQRRSARLKRQVFPFTLCRCR